MKQSIEERVRLVGDGTAHTDIPHCSYIRGGERYTPRCKPDTCKHINKFYSRIKRQ